MKLATEVSPEKLRGGFYSPQDLVLLCLNRVAELLGDVRELEALEPSAGDGAFIRGLKSHNLGQRISKLTAVEILGEEASKCRGTGEGSPFTLEVFHGSFLSPIVDAQPKYDVAFGNPPYVRFQFVDAADRRRAEDLAADIGVALKGVSNLWIPIILKALTCLREGGAFAFIVPAECMTGISAAVVRKFLLSQTSDLRLDLFPPSSFPDVLQEVVILSGIKASQRPAEGGEVTIGEHHGPEREWRHRVDAATHTWTKLLLTPGQVDAFNEAVRLPSSIELARVAKFSVATVTGANDFFSVDRETVERFELQGWTKPLLPRIRSASGLIFTCADHKQAVEAGAKAALLDFSADTPDPAAHPMPRSYVAIGEEALLHERYKCRIRSPWYRVPVVAPGELLLSKRSHLYPRMVLNEARAITTDTIYQGNLTPAFQGQGEALTAAFHNSLTALSAEVEGRSFGGGVLELVPSEVGRLRVFASPKLADDLEKLDAISRSSDPDKDDVLIEETDRRLAKCVDGLTDSLLASLSDARRALQQRRLNRNRSGVGRNLPAEDVE